jgi:hypothetical protein
MVKELRVNKINIVYNKNITVKKRSRGKSKEKTIRECKVNGLLRVRRRWKGEQQSLEKRKRKESNEEVVRGLRY